MWSKHPVLPGGVFACEGALLWWYTVSVASCDAANDRGVNSLSHVLACGQCVAVEADLGLRVLDAYELSRLLRRGTKRGLEVERSELVEGPAFLVKMVVAVILARVLDVYRSWFLAAPRPAASTKLPGSPFAPRLCHGRVSDADRAGEDDRCSTACFSELAEDDGCEFVTEPSVLHDISEHGVAGHDLVLEFEVPSTDVASVSDAQWANPAFYATFLLDTAPECGDWISDRRVILTQHPLGVKPPKWTGIRGSIPTRKTQRRFAEPDRVVVYEESNFQDIPFSDAIVVRTLWIVDEAPSDASAARVRIFFRTLFGDAVPRWLRSLIAARTKDELSLVYDNYEHETIRALDLAAARESSRPSEPKAAPQGARQTTALSSLPEHSLSQGSNPALS